MNTFHSLVPVILVQLICQARCVDHRRGAHKLPLRPSLLPPRPSLLPSRPSLLPPRPSLLPPHYPSGIPYNPYNPFVANPLASPYWPPMYPFASPYGFMPNMQPSFSKFLGQEYPAEAEDFSNSESSYMPPPTPPNPQAYGSNAYTSPSLSYMPSTPFNTSPSYMAPNLYTYFTPSSPTYTTPPSSFAPSSPNYFASSPQSPTVPSYTPTQSAPAQPTAQPQPASPNVISQTLPPANQTSTTQEQVLPALPANSSIHFADNSTITPGVMTTENETQINTMMAPENQSLTDLPANAALPNPSLAADETPVISTNGETITDMNSLPPQVKEFIDMIPNILAMPDSQAMAANDQQPPAEKGPRPSPFSLHKPPKSPKRFPLHKRKPLHPYYPPHPATGYSASPYPSPIYQPPLPLPVANY